MNNKKTEILQIVYYLVKDAFFLYLAGGIGFLLAETVLPGVLSQRINFFFLYAGFLILLGGVILLGRISSKEKDQKQERITEKKKQWNTQTRVFVVGIGVLCLIPIMRNVPITLLPFFGVGTAVVLLMLTESFFKDANKLK